MKRLTALLLIVCMLLTPALAVEEPTTDLPDAGCIASPDSAEEADPEGTDIPGETIAPAPVDPAPVDPAAETAARELYDMGLFQGIGTDEAGQPVFALERTLTRQEAVTMLVRLLGKEAEALASGYPSPFADHADWAAPYVSYAWVFSLTMGNGDGSFGGENSATAAQYVTLLLRALGYTTPADFAWENALTKAAELGLTAADRYTDPNATLTRADAALLSRAALELSTKSGTVLRETISKTASVATPYKNTNPTFAGRGGSSKAGRIFIEDEAGTGIGWKKALQAANDLDIAPNDGKIRVLIVHTHATEAYSEADGLAYKASDDHRTTDYQRNMLRVGRMFTDVLNSRGIGTVHITELHDYPKYVGAYDNSADSLKDYLKKYPDVEMIIDIHRDAARWKGQPLRSLARVDGFETAQLMFVCSSTNAGWKGRLGIALGIHDRMEQQYPGIMRPVVLRKTDYNQNLSPGSLLVEVGTDGNTLSEAIYSARLLADVLVDYLTEN